jgi:hypothetical protein
VGFLFMPSFDDFLDEFGNEMSGSLVDLGNTGKPETRPGEVGYRDVNGNWVVPVPGRTGYIYVTCDESVVPAVNAGVPLIGGFPVIVTFYTGNDPVVYDPDVFKVIQFAGDNLNINVGGVAPHSHRLRYGMVDFVESLRFEPGVVVPVEAGSLEVRIMPFVYMWQGTRYYWSNTQPITVTAPSTAGKRWWAKVGIRTDTTPHTSQVVYGAEQSIAGPLGISELLSLILNGLWLAGIKIDYAQTSYDYADDFFDLRTFTGNDQTLATNPRVIYSGEVYTIQAGRGAVWAGDLQIESGGLLVVEDGARLVIV